MNKYVSERNVIDFHLLLLITHTVIL